MRSFTANITGQCFAGQPALFKKALVECSQRRIPDLCLLDIVESGQSDVFARQVSLAIQGVTGAVFEDNFFDLVPGQKKQVRVLHAAGGRRLIVRAVNAEPMEVAL